MIRAARRYLVPASLLVVSAVGFWASWHIFSLHVVNGDIPTGLIVSSVGAAASVYMLVLSVFLLIRRRAFLTINPFAILAAYLSIPVALLVASLYIALLIMMTSLNSLTF